MAADEGNGERSPEGRSHGLARAFESPIEELKPESYQECRSEFSTGDMLCFRGKGPLSWIIRVLTRSFYSHAGLVYWHESWDRPRLYCVEAVGKGVRLILMSELEKRYKGGFDYFSVDHADAVAKQKAVGFCFEQLGKPYDIPGLWRFFAAIVLGRVEQARQDDYWFCSELVAAAYHSQGKPLAPRTPEYTSPHDLAESRHVTYRFTVKPS